MNDATTGLGFRLDPTLIGTVLGVTSKRSLNQNQINDFAKITDDLQWIHVDPQRAAEGPYGMTVAHGYFVLALLPSFTRELVDFQEHGAVINYGLDSVRFLGAARVGESLHDEITLSGLTDKPGGTLVQLGHKLSRSDTGELLCIAKTLTLIRPFE